MDSTELLMGIAEIATALAGFTGVVVVFGSRNHGNWHPGDRLRLSFMLEASLTAGAFALLTLFFWSFLPLSQSCVVVSGLWAVAMICSLYYSRVRLKRNKKEHDDIDRVANGVVFSLFATLIVVQIINVIYWQTLAPLAAALIMNLAGSAMQFVRLIESAFHE